MNAAKIIDQKFMHLEYWLFAEDWISIIFLCSAFYGSNFFAKN